ncbi:MAG: GNAT family N-acetyltransferase [Hyphomonadaceae bacterium]|nr:GNAT family N-acetyltransferase [Hyphomonadaceae bacterium]
MSELRDNAAQSRYEIDVDGEIVFADYWRADGKLIINWVEAPPKLRGTGAAGKLMTLVAEQAKGEGVRIMPMCGYAAGWLRASKQYRDLIA